MTCGYTTACTGCKECEGFCQATAASHSYHQMVRNAQGAANAPTINKDDIIIKKLPKDLYNQLVGYINAALSLGSPNSGHGYRVPTASSDFLTASEITQLYQAFQGRLGPAGSATVSRDDVVYANFFQALMTKINTATFDTNACHTCNTTCNSNCKTTYRVRTGCNDCCNCTSA